MGRSPGVRGAVVSRPTRRYLSTKGYPSPVNSAGLPYREGDIWTCSACGQSGPDRDDVEMARCPGEPRMGAHLGELTFSCRSRTTEAA